MVTYHIPELKELPKPNPSEAILVASGDLRLPANQQCWPAQEDMERRVVEAFAKEGITVKRGHPMIPTSNTASSGISGWEWMYSRIFTPTRG